MGELLAVDTGVRVGLALYGADGRLCWYRSRNFGSAGRLKKAVPAVLGELPGLSWLVLEGGGTPAEPWAAQGKRRGVPVLSVPAERWREALLIPRERRSGAEAKRNADGLARRVIEWSGAARPTSLRHDAAEAILAGLWGALETGLLADLPAELRHA